MPSKKQKQQKAHKLKLREDAAATWAAKEAARQAREAAKQGNTVSRYNAGITPRLLSPFLLLCRPGVAAARTKRIKRCNGRRHTADTAQYERRRLKMPDLMRRILRSREGAWMVGAGSQTLQIV